MGLNHTPGLAGLALLLVWPAGNVTAASTEVSPELGTEKIIRLIQQAAGGDTLLFGPGTYTGPFVLEHLYGTENRPVVIMGKDRDRVVIDGKSDPGMSLNHQAFVLRECSWINIEQLSIRNCWTDLVRAEDTHHLSLRYCLMEGGKRALFATGRGSHHFLVEHCTWEQDERVWTHEDGYSWEEIHHGIYSHYNGSLFQGSEISGVFVLRDNQIRNTFNAFRLSLINDGATDLLACTNGEIYRNTITNTSDNVLEPEVHARNLHFYHNRMINGHAFISITEVAGGDIYIYGNTAVSMPESADGWTVFKISSGATALSHPLYIFNNSWQVDFDIIGSPRDDWRNKHIRHFNNAVVSEASDSFGIYMLGLDNSFDYDCSNVPFPDLLTGNGFEAHGVVADPLFRDPYRDDFRLNRQSPCIDRGRMDPVILSFDGSNPDIGAYEGESLIQGQAFRFIQPDTALPYREMPRITRHRVEGGGTLSLWFSVPLSEESVLATAWTASTGKESFPLGVTTLSEDGYCLMLSAEDLNVPDRLTENSSLVLHCSRWPRGTNGMNMTSWAGTIPVTIH